jgi:AcrR family transcriptional regulator
MSVMADRSGRLPRQERRAQLLEAAREAFVLQGYHAAGMDGIAVLAGVSKPVLYQHFPGKLELYLAVLDQSSDSLIDRVRNALDSTTDNRKRVRATFEAYFDFVAHESGAFRLIFESDLTNVPEATDRVARTNETCGQMIAEVIREDTELDDDTSMLLASGLLGMAQTAARHWLHSPAPISQQSAAKAMSILAWRGLSEFPLTHPQT